MIDDDLRVSGGELLSVGWDGGGRNGSIWGEGGGILLKVCKNEYVVGGRGMVLEFRKR